MGIRENRNELRNRIIGNDFWQEHRLTLPTKCSLITGYLYPNGIDRISWYDSNISNNYMIVLMQINRISRQVCRNFFWLLPYQSNRIRLNNKIIILGVIMRTSKR